MTKKHIEDLKALYYSPTWEALVALKDEEMSKILVEKPSLGTEWLFMQEALRSQGKMDGIHFFLKDIENLASKE